MYVCVCVCVCLSERGLPRVAAITHPLGNTLTGRGECGSAACCHMRKSAYTQCLWTKTGKYRHRKISSVFTGEWEPSALSFRRGLLCSVFQCFVIAILILNYNCGWQGRVLTRGTLAWCLENSPSGKEKRKRKRECLCVCECVCVRVRGRAHIGISAPQPGANHTCIPSLPVYVCSYCRSNCVWVCLCEWVCVCVRDKTSAFKDHGTVQLQMQKPNKHTNSLICSCKQESQWHSKEILVIPILQWGAGIQHNSLTLFSSSDREFNGIAYPSCVAMRTEYLNANNRSFYVLMWNNHNGFSTQQWALFCN